MCPGKQVLTGVFGWLAVFVVINFPLSSSTLKCCVVMSVMKRKKIKGKKKKGCFTDQDVLCISLSRQLAPSLLVQTYQCQLSNNARRIFGDKAALFCFSVGKNVFILSIKSLFTFTMPI